MRIEKPADFFAQAQAEYPDPPVWVGELYLELHRGTYTSQAKTKQGNRRSEHLLREAELWAATAAVRGGYQYPYEELDRLWKTVLLHQFHDILPGSSIAWVHREARATYAAVAAELEELIAGAQQALTGHPAARETSASGRRAPARTAASSSTQRRSSATASRPWPPGVPPRPRPPSTRGTGPAAASAWTTACSGWSSTTAAWSPR